MIQDTKTTLHTFGKCAKNGNGKDERSLRNSNEEKKYELGYQTITEIIKKREC